MMANTVPSWQMDYMKHQKMNYQFTTLGLLKTFERRNIYKYLPTYSPTPPTHPLTPMTNQRSE
jgi:hypothetical protein